MLWCPAAPVNVTYPMPYCILHYKNDNYNYSHFVLSQSPRACPSSLWYIDSHSMGFQERLGEDADVPGSTLSCSSSSVRVSLLCWGRLVLRALRERHTFWQCLFSQDPRLRTEERATIICSQGFQSWANDLLLTILRKKMTVLLLNRNQRKCEINGSKKVWTVKWTKLLAFQKHT